MTQYVAKADVTLVPEENWRYVFFGTLDRDETVDGDHVTPESLQDALDEGLLGEAS